MIILSTGAELDKKLDIRDFANGAKYSPKLGLIGTFQPCDFCKNDKCKRTTFKECIDEYQKLWFEWKESNKHHAPRNEAPLMKSYDYWLSCSTCFYYKGGFCGRRERTIRWNPHGFVCSDYGVKDEPFGQMSIDDYCKWTYTPGGRI